LKKLIDDFIKQNDSILEFLNKTSQDYENADKVIIAFANTLRHTKFNVALGLEFANVLQLSNDKNNFEQYNLDDISRLFATLLRLQEFNLSTYVDSAHFEWSVMNNADKAKAIAVEGIAKSKQKIEQLQQLLDFINSA